MEDVFIWGGIWIICGILSGVIASSKNRSGCVWFLVGFLLGPLGIIASGFMSKLEVSNDQQVEVESVEIQLERYNPDQDIFEFNDKKLYSFAKKAYENYSQGSDGRWYNNFQIEAAPNGVEDLVAARKNYLIKKNIIKMPETKVCPFCAETIKYAAKVCRFCGRELPDNSENNEQQS